MGKKVKGKKGEPTMSDYGKMLRSMRKGSRKNEDGSVSTHLMAWGESDGEYVAYPTLFQRGDGSWYESENPFREAVLRNEVFSFPTKNQAQNFAEGSWKEKQKLPFKKIKRVYNGKG